MDAKPERKGQIEYLQEGFILHWDEELLTVEVIDYHATVLRLTWKDVQSLAAIATGEPRPKTATPKAKGPHPHEV